MFLVPFLRGLTRHLHVASFALTALVTAAYAQSTSTNAADGFDPNVDGNVYAMAMQPLDGKVIIAGQFANVSPHGGISIARNNLARLNADGTLDLGFDPNVNGPVRAVVLQRDGSIIIGGDFTKVGTEDRYGLARLSPTGALDTSFRAGVDRGTGLQSTKPQVMAIALQEDDSIVVGGTFAVARWGTGSTASRNNLARFTSAGVLDVTYDPNPNAMVLAIALHVDGKMVIGGAFTELGAPEKTSRLRIARLNRNGTVDSEFNPRADNGVTSLAVQHDGKILLGGFFTTLQPRGSDSAANRNHLARLNVDGTLDSEFYPGINGDVAAVAIAPDGGILIGGPFSQVTGRGDVVAARSYVARLKTDGTVDEAFAPGANGTVTAFAFQPDGKIVLGGYFTRLQPEGAIAAVVRNRVARILSNGALDTAFQLESGGRILASVEQADGKVVVVGTFTSIAGVTRNYIARLNADGSLDTSYNPNFNGPAYSIAYQNSKGENKVLVGGVFTQAGGSDRLRFVRLNADGTVDSEFNPKFDGTVGAIVIQPDGKIVVSGTFTTVHPFGDAEATARPYIARLLDTGKLDTAFYPSPNSQVTDMALQSDNKLIIVGAFTALQPGGTGTVTGRAYIARLNSDGSLDTAYNPLSQNAISTVALQGDKAIIGGRFRAFRPNNTGDIIARDFLARVNADGTIDSAFDPSPDNYVLTLEVQTNKKILVGGLFTTMTPGRAGGATAWKQTKYVARLNEDGTVDTSFNLDLNELGGNRVDSLSVTRNADILVGGTFTSLQPTGTTSRVLRDRFARIKENGTLDASFVVTVGGSFNAEVRAISVQADGKIVVAGNFAELGRAASANISRFNPEGTPDGLFNSVVSTAGGTGSADSTGVHALAIRATGEVEATQLTGFAWLDSAGALNPAFRPTIKLSGRVYSALIDRDGGLVLAGSFSDLSNTTSGNLIRFKANGEIDANFKPSVSGAVLSIAQQTDKKYIIGGAFTTVNGVTRNRIARLNTDGTMDTGFDPNPDNTVNSVVIDEGSGAVYVGGNFANFTPNGATSATARTFLARLTSAGALDANYVPNPNGAIYALALEAGGKLIAGGAFTSVQPNGAAAATERKFIARFETNGNVDPNFKPAANDIVNALVIEPGTQSIAFAGSFTIVDGASRVGIARVGSDGVLDAAFAPKVNAPITSLARAGDGSLIIGGAFTTVTSSGDATGTAVARNHIARLTGQGVLDPSFNPDVAGTVQQVKVASDGSILVSGSFSTLQANGLILVGGNFATIGGVAVPNLAQLNGDGSVNAGFQPKPNGAVRALLPLGDGSFVVGGAFTSIANGVARNGIARFNSAGVLDASFAPTLPGAVESLAAQSDGKLIVGTSGVIRLNADGSRDNAFNNTIPFFPAHAVAVQRDGKVLVAGPGSGVPTRLVRLNGDGSADTTFPVLTAEISAITLQADGGIIVAGSFTNLAGSGISRVARLRADGTVDTSFKPAPNGAVSALALQSDGRLMIGGRFTQLGDLPRSGLARVGNTAAATQYLTVNADRTTITWVRRGTGGEVSAVAFEKSNDGLDWEPLGVGTRVASSADWQLTNITQFPTPGVSFYIRARGIAPSSAGKSTSVFESVRMVNLASPVPGIGLPVAAVSSTVAWDQNHYVWTVDGSGVLRIADAFSFSIVDANRTVLIGSTSATNSDSKLADLSTRGEVSSSSPLISGFAIAGSGQRSVLVRAVGPGLNRFGVSNPLTAPQLVLKRSDGTLIGSNAGWNNDPALAATFVRTGAFPFEPNSADSALVATLQPGTYTVQVLDGGTASAGGNALVEIYDAGELGDTSTRLVNLSSRGTVSGQGPLIGGLIISGTHAKTLLVRGVGPALTKFGVGGVLTDPRVAVYDAAGIEVVSNDNWQVANQPTIPELDFGAGIAAAAASVNAFPLESGSKDAALIITLPPGAYTVQVSGGTGTGMIEVYELP